MEKKLKHIFLSLLILVIALPISAQSEQISQSLLLKLPQNDKPFIDKAKLRFSCKDYIVASVQEEDLESLKENYEILDKAPVSLEQRYYMFRVKSVDELTQLKKIAQILDNSNGNVLIKLNENAQIGQVPVKSKFKLLPEFIPWPRKIRKSFGFMAPRSVYGAISHSTITAILASLSTAEVSGYIQALQNIGTRYSFSPKCNDARDYLVANFSSFGLEVTTFPFKNVSESSTTNYNVIATLPGKLHPEKIFVICAHYDSISEDPLNSAPGADDNGSGVTAVLMAAKYLKQYDFAYTIKFICFSGEEQGMVGSFAYVKSLYQADTQILGALNVDMIAYAKPGVKYDLNVTENESSQQLGEYLDFVDKDYVQHPLAVTTNNDAWWSDHAAFWEYGYPALELSEAYDWDSPDFNPYYHSTRETIDKLDLVFTLKNIKVAVATLAELADVYTTELVTTNPAGWNTIISKGNLYDIEWVNADNQQASLYYAETFDGEKHLIANVDGTLKKYQWDTTNVIPGKYWIFMQAQSGYSWSSGQVTIFSNDFERLMIYPNPCVDQATISGLAENTRMKIFNVAGEMVLERVFTNQFSWSWYLVNGNYDKLGCGVYTCLFQSSTGKKAARKFAIIR
ncbi:MAG: M20/M25/M40 family metallo-hydrolase [Elusimicrobiota bacterium]